MQKAKGKNKKNYKGFFDKLLESFFDSVEENAENILEKVSDFAFLKTAAKRYMVFVMLTTVALLMILCGLGLMINTYFSAISLWATFLSIGIITFIIGWIYLRIK
ncbi:MAG: hypothetical protein PF542_04875 [Nanoarchaeota archaeon]|jgi:hypothetical protein|nr:hypothetical protein [Nanoarchaeota archaeon]